MLRLSQLDALSLRINGVNQQSLDEHKIVGSVVIAAQQGKIIYQQACGYANY